MNTPVDTRNREFNLAAQQCGLSTEELLKLKDQFEVAGWVWQRFGERVQCGNGRACWTVERSELLAQTHTDGLVVTELRGEQAMEAISDFAGLSLVPIEPDEWHQKLARAGFRNNPSQRSVARSDQRADIDL